jgi:hypothetical protein
MSVISNGMTGGAASRETRDARWGGALRFEPVRLVAYSWLLALVPISVLQVVHADLHESPWLPPLLHLVRDGALAVPAAAASLVVATLIVGWRRPRSDGGSLSFPATLAWAALAAGLFALLSMPGNELHGFLFHAEEEAGTSIVEDLLVDGLYAFQAGAAVLIPIALFAGGPWRGTRQEAGRPAAAPSRPGDDA